MSGADEQRRTEQGELIGVRTLRGFLKRVLADDAVADKVDDPLFEHVVEGCYHPSVVPSRCRSSSATSSPRPG